jgi:ubiquinone/menaquinone biosynthesis C-methylase UbiE
LEPADYEAVLERRFSPEEIEREYSRVVWMYDAWARLTESKATKRALEVADIHDGESVLEVAVGTGIAFKEIVMRNRHGRNEGVDISPTMLSAAVNRMRRSGIDSGCYRLEVGNAYKLPFKDGEFDLVVNNYMLDLLPEEDFAAILREFLRVLRPSGRLVVVTMTFGPRWYNRIWHWVARHFPSALTNCRPVLIEKYVLEAGFRSVNREYVSQNTFPSQMVVATQ